MTNLSEEKIFQINFNLQDVATLQGFEINPTAAAEILRISERDFVGYVNEADKVVAEAAHELKSEPVIANMVRELNQYVQVLTIGDSITTYRYSYARLLHQLLPDVEVINHAYSGYTSNHGLELTHTTFIQLLPDVVFIKYGVNDCKRFGGANGRTLVSADEYRGNIRGIVKAFQTYTDAQVVLITPTPIVTSIVNASEDFMAMHMTWQNSDLKLFAGIMQELSVAHGTKLADLYTIFGDESDAALFLPDGLHPNFVGQQAMLRTIAGVFD